MASSLLILVDNLMEGIHKIERKDSDCFCEYDSVNESLIKYKCLSYNKNIQTRLMKNQKINSRIHLSFLIMI